MPKTSESESLILRITDSIFRWVPIQKFWNQIPKILESESLIPRITDSIFRWDDCKSTVQTFLLAFWFKRPWGFSMDSPFYECVSWNENSSWSWYSKITVFSKYVLSDFTSRLPLQDYHLDKVENGAHHSTVQKKYNKTTDILYKLIFHKHLKNWSHSHLH